MAKKRGPSRKTRKPRQRQQQPTALIALVVAAVILVLACLYIIPFIPDDSYISFRYSENLANGHGLSFNAGERLEAYSNFLWILFGALLHTLGMFLPVAMPYAGLFLGLAALALLWRMCRARVEHDSQLFLPLLVFSLASPLVIYLVSGMETALFAFLLLGVVYSADRVYSCAGGRWWIAMAAAGLLLALTRPEGVLVLPLVVAWMLWDSRREESFRSILHVTLLALAAYAVAYGAYTVWRVDYFGEWLPTPYMSKGHDAFPLVTALKTNFRQYFVRGGFVEAPTGYYFLALTLMGTAALLYGPRDDTRRTDRLALVVAVVMSLVYVNFVDWMPAMRYHAPLIVLFCLPLVRLQRLIPVERWKGFSRGEVAAALAVVLLMGVYGIHRVKTVTAEMSLGRVECTIPLGEWLGDVLPPGALIAIGDVGAVPYYSGLRTLDIHPESLTDRLIAQAGLSVDYMLSRQPDAVMLNARGVYSAKMDEHHYKYYHHRAFASEYNFIGTVRHRWFTDRAYWVFIHESLRLRDDHLRAFPRGLGTQQRLGFEFPEDTR